MTRIKVAAIQMRAVLGDLRANMGQAESLAVEAFRAGAQWVILPEFFPSAVAFHPKMLDVAQPIEGPAMRLLKGLATEYGGVAGGSFIAYRNGHCYNTFVLAMPDGSVYTHDKDQPTMWENCYYTGGNDDGVIGTGDFRVGVAMCWEFIRSRTARRLKDKVDVVVVGSCWWDLPDQRLPGFSDRVSQKNLEIMKDTPSRFARMLGVPVIHAAHAGEFQAGLPLVPGFRYRSHYLGETCIVDGTGKTLARMSREQGEGYVMAEIDLGAKCSPSEPIPRSFWIPDIPAPIRMAWAYQNLHGQRYYRKVTLPRIRRLFEAP